MCNRIGLSRDIDTIRTSFGVAHRHPPLTQHGTVAPGGALPVIRRDLETGSRRLDLMRWGLVSAWSKNALVVRSHVHGAQPGELAQSRRCLVPLDHFYESRMEDKQAFAVALAGQKMMVLAGLWQLWVSPLGERNLRFAILTTSSSEALAAFGKRMPAILSPGEWDAWLDEAEPALLRPLSGALLALRPVAREAMHPGTAIC